MGISTKNLLLFVCLLLCMVINQNLSHADDPANPVVEMTAKEQKFKESMQGTVLVGQFSIVGKEKADAPKQERYEIKSVTKISEGMWTFTTRVKYGKVDTELPIPVPLVWAGDTPMVSMTNFTIPGMGTFSCRVIFDGDRYAGTWQHGPKGGHMWGTIEKGNKGDKEVEGKVEKSPE